MDNNCNTEGDLPTNCVHNRLLARAARYVGGLIVSYKIIEPAYFSYIYFNVISIEYILGTLTMRALPWIFIGASIFQAGRWLDRGDGVYVSAGKLMQALGVGAIAFMLIFFVPGYLQTEADKSIAVYSFFYIVIGLAILITGLCLFYLGVMLKRRASKSALIGFSVVNVIFIFISLRLIH